jgi:hypothetical protein
MESNDNLEEEIWSEFFRTKNTLMDHYSNFSSALGMTRILMRKKREKDIEEQLGRCQFQVGELIRLGTKSYAFKNVPQADKERMKNIAKGQWKTIDDFEWCEDKFDEWFMQTRFFDINIKKERMKAPHEY